MSAPLASEENLHARRLFDPLAPEYDVLLEALTFFQNSRWRRYLISRLDLRPGALVLDLCTGTAGVAIQMARRRPCHVVGVDLSHGMLETARARVQASGLHNRISLALGNAESLSFSDGCFDAVTFTYLLRYVKDPQATLSEIARVLKPGGSISALDFYLPEHPAVRLLWALYTQWGLRAATHFVSDGWRYVGGFLGASISRFYQRYSVDDLLDMWRSVGISDVQAKRLTAGGALLMWGNKAR